MVVEWAQKHNFLKRPFPDFANPDVSMWLGRLIFASDLTFKPNPTATSDTATLTNPSYPDVYLEVRPIEHNGLNSE